MWFSKNSLRGSSYDPNPRSYTNARRTPINPAEARFSSATTKLVVGLSCIVLIIIAQLVRFQIVTASDLSHKAQAQRNNIVTLFARRGTIYDRNGNVLAISRECRTVYANPKKVNDPSGAAQIIADTVGGTTDNYTQALTGDTTFAYVVKRISIEDAKTIQQKLGDAKITGVYMQQDIKREYPYGAVAAQVLGVVGADQEGLTGLELYYNDTLKGTNGKMIFEAGRGGTPIAGEHPAIEPASHGQDIILGIDVNVQRTCEETITQAIKDYSAKAGSVMVTDPLTGEILAACSTPLYDPADVAEIPEGALNLKSISSTFEPGSTFKPITQVIALDTKSVSPNQSFDVPVELKVGDSMVHDAEKRKEAMTMTLRDILVHSSNVGNALIAQHYIGADKFSSGVAAFQFGTKTGIDFPGEIAGMVKQRVEYDGSTLGTMAFGQGLSIPQVQMVQAIGAIANRGSLYTPHFLIARGGSEVSWPAKANPLSSDTADEIASYMRDVVKDKHNAAAAVEGYDVAGKTGTAEKPGENGRYLSDSFTSSFIGFAPASAPRIQVSVMLDGTPYLAYASAAPTFSKIMKNSLGDLGIAPQ